MWAMYKEVAEYYQHGVSLRSQASRGIQLTIQLKVPDDITILFTDDNYGNLQTVQDPEKEPHPAGAGMYYHVDCMYVDSKV
jgi:hypothetical protein